MSTARVIPVAGNSSRAMAYVSLTKPDVSFLVVMTTLAGYYLGSRGALDWVRMFHTVFGTTLVAAGTSALNHYIERASDAFMRRTGIASTADRSASPARCRYFRRFTCSSRHSLFGAGRRPAGRRTGIVHIRKLPRALYAAEEAHNARYRRWRHSWRDAAAHRMGRRARIALQRGLAPFRNYGSVAIPALFRHRLDVSRRLRPSRNQNAAHRGPAGHAHVPPNYRRGDFAAARKFISRADGHGRSSLFLRRGSVGFHADSTLPVGFREPHQRSCQVVDARHGAASAAASGADDVRQDSAISLFGFVGAVRKFRDSIRPLRLNKGDS